METNECLKAISLGLCDKMRAPKDVPNMFYPVESSGLLRQLVPWLVTFEEEVLLRTRATGLLFFGGQVERGY